MNELISVVLPAPDGPMIAITRDPRAVPLMLCSSVRITFLGWFAGSAAYSSLSTSTRYVMLRHASSTCRSGLSGVCAVCTTGVRGVLGVVGSDALTTALGWSAADSVVDIGLAGALRV